MGPYWMQWWGWGMQAPLPVEHPQASRYHMRARNRSVIRSIFLFLGI